MVLAAFHRGPYDGEHLLLPCERDRPWPRFVIPEFGKLIVTTYFYLYSGWEDDLALYLYDERNLLTLS